ncbi:hypothetical protein BMF90_11410 [Serratia sp. OLHL2]|uniref:DUF3251 domain-containing protein n=1 Tax=Serratia TaxID=613 RepID=UPI000C18D425|nr:MULTISPECIES: DUF3251 domain-containing protein [Serratia]MBH3007366.1 DUF3251 domain-containing protein [Serratia ureilytica]MBH3123314.1 DUF3251 domain-containing protein [Serratia ureilytica]MBH3154230.1 DUF3251 domain-containing protein [Serratia ureilytica]MBN5283211.1 DUF3251 domain-containing protein [Serratia ureilytica]PII52869.1 hypothetical protein BMF87_11725 [Serratia sp. OLEL1]
MTTRSPKIALLAAAVLLTGCAHNAAVPQLRHQVAALNQKVSVLTDQATALERQNQLNQHSDNGVYLLPAARSAARLQSGIGELSVSLSHIKSEANGAQAQLHVRILSQATLPPFKAVVEWGQLDAATGRPLTAEALSQPIASADSLLPKPGQDFELRFSGLTPEQLGYIRLHSLVATAQPAVVQQH